MAGKNFFIPTSRIEAFSDGVFAIVITLLAFQFKIPKFTSGATLQQNFQELLVISPNFIAFVFSFLFVAVFWINHHQLYHSIKEADSKLLWYNVHVLFWITLVPFPISMVGDHPQLQISAISLGFVLLMCCLAAYLVRNYTYFTAKLVDQTLSQESVKDGMRKNILAIILNIIAIGASLISVYIAYGIFVVVLGLFIIPQKLEKKTKST